MQNLVVIHGKIINNFSEKNLKPFVGSLFLNLIRFANLMKQILQSNI